MFHFGVSNTEEGFSSLIYAQINTADKGSEAGRSPDSQDDYDWLRGTHWDWDGLGHVILHPDHRVSYTCDVGPRGPHPTPGPDTHHHPQPPVNPQPQNDSDSLPHPCGSPKPDLYRALDPAADSQPVHCTASDLCDPDAGHAANLDPALAPAAIVDPVSPTDSSRDLTPSLTATTSPGLNSSDAPSPALIPGPVFPDACADDSDAVIAPDLDDHCPDADVHLHSDPEPPPDIGLVPTHEPVPTSKHSDPEPPPNIGLVPTHEPVPTSNTAAPVPSICMALNDDLSPHSNLASVPMPTLTPSTTAVPESDAGSSPTPRPNAEPHPDLCGGLESDPHPDPYATAKPLPTQTVTEPPTPSPNLHLNFKVNPTEGPHRMAPGRYGRWWVEGDELWTWIPDQGTSVGTISDDWCLIEGRVSLEGGPGAPFKAIRAEQYPKPLRTWEHICEDYLLHVGILSQRCALCSVLTCRLLGGRSRHGAGMGVVPRDHAQFSWDGYRAPQVILSGGSMRGGHLAPFWSPSGPKPVQMLPRAPQHVRRPPFFPSRGNLSQRHCDASARAQLWAGMIISLCQFAGLLLG